MQSISSNCPVFTGKKYRISILSDRLIRFEYNSEGIFLDDQTFLAMNRDFPSTRVEVSEDSKILVVSSKYFAFQYTKEAPFFSSKLFPDSNLRVKLNGTDKLWYPNHPEVRNFQSNGFSIDDLKNISMHKSLYSTDGFVSIDDSKGLVIDSNDNVSMRVDNSVDIYLFVYRRDFAGCLKDFFTLSGNAPLLPKKALGIWWNRDRVYSDDNAITLVNLFDKYDIPLSVFLFSEFWHIKDPKNMNLHKSGYTFDSNLFKNPSEFISLMNSKNILVGLNFDPSDGVRKEETSYQMFLDKFPQKNNENIAFNMFDLDFVKLFNSKILNPLKDIGVDFLWVDYKEKKSYLAALNYYVDKTNFGKRNLTMTRNFGIGSHRSAVLYSGETTVSWKTLDYLPKYNSGACDYGLSWWSHDVGGFKDGIESDELYLRYVQTLVYSPIFRFSAKRGPYYKREPWLWDIKTMTIVKNYCHMRYRLIPYIYSEGYKYSKYGMPFIRPLYYDSPFIYDEPVYKNEYYFGSEFIVAAITKPMNELIKRSIERVYLPEGVWYDFKSGKKFIGDKRYVTFYKDEDYPVFVKNGGIVPLSILGKTKNDLSNPDALEVHIFPGKSNTYKLYEDDGESLDYQNGEYMITSFDYNYMQNNYTFIIRPLEGNDCVIPKVRNYIIKFRNTKKADDVSIYLNGERYSNFDIGNDENNFDLKIYNVDTSKQLTINCKGHDIEIDATHIFNEDINSILYDLEIETNLKEELASIMFSDKDIKRKRILVNKLKKKGLHVKFANMFLKLLEYSSEI